MSMYLFRCDVPVALLLLNVLHNCKMLLVGCCIYIGFETV